MFQKAFASEFPHDNPALSDGATWLCPSVCARPLPCGPGVLLRGEPRKPRAVASEGTSASPQGAPLAAQGASLTAAADRGEMRGPGVRRVQPLPPLEPENAFQRFVRAMVSAALAQGATHVAAELPAILAEGRLRPMFDESAQRALRARGYLSAEGAASTTFATVAEGWRRVLEGSSEDFSMCGDKTLDEWGSGLLASLLGRAPQAAEELRKALRGAGVAAFGMREAA